MIDELVELFHRQTAAVTALEGRLRALELVVAANEQRFLTHALDELERASEQLAALELTRVLALSTAGLPVEVTARDLSASIADPDAEARMRDAADELREAMRHVLDARERATVVVSTSSREARVRLEAAGAFASV